MDINRDIALNAVLSCTDERVTSMIYTIPGKSKVIRFETNYFVYVTKVDGGTYLSIKNDDNEDKITDHYYESSDLSVCCINGKVYISIVTDEDFIPELMEDLKKAGIQVEKI